MTWTEGYDLRCNAHRFNKMIYLLTKVLYEKDARLHLDQLGAKLTKLNDKQSKYIGVKADGPNKPGLYRY